MLYIGTISAYWVLCGLNDYRYRLAAELLGYFHSQSLPIELPFSSTSYSKTQAILTRCRHAGPSPRWSEARARSRAAAVSSVIQGWKITSSRFRAATARRRGYPGACEPAAGLECDWIPSFSLFSCQSQMQTEVSKSRRSRRTGFHSKPNASRTFPGICPKKA